MGGCTWVVTLGVISGFRGYEPKRTTTFTHHFFSLQIGEGALQLF